MNMNNLVLLRGLPGSGKSTVADLIGGNGAGSAHFEADMYFMKDGKYQFDASKLRFAHEWCRSQTEKAMMEGLAMVVVSNTFTQEWEMENYINLAKQYGYRVTSLIVENRHGGVNVHGVPEDKLKQMKDRFEVSL